MNLRREDATAYYRDAQLQFFRHIGLEDNGCESDGLGMRDIARRDRAGETLKLCAHAFAKREHGRDLVNEATAGRAIQLEEFFGIVREQRRRDLETERFGARHVGRLALGDLHRRRLAGQDGAIEAVPDRLEELAAILFDHRANFGIRDRRMRNARPRATEPHGIQLFDLDDAISEPQRVTRIALTERNGDPRGRGEVRGIEAHDVSSALTQELFDCERRFVGGAGNDEDHD